jgi:hypothetical protein
MKPGLKEPGFLRYNFGFRRALIQVDASRKHAGIAQLVERNLAKVEVASSSLVSRSRFKKGSSASLFCQSLSSALFAPNLTAR